MPARLANESNGGSPAPQMNRPPKLQPSAPTTPAANIRSISAEPSRRGCHRQHAGARRRVARQREGHRAAANQQHVAAGRSDRVDAPSSVKIQLPKMELTGPMKADLEVLRADGSLASKSAIELTPAATRLALATKENNKPPVIDRGLNGHKQSKCENCLWTTTEQLLTSNALYASPPTACPTCLGRRFLFCRSGFQPDNRPGVSAGATSLVHRTSTSCSDCSAIRSIAPSHGFVSPKIKSRPEPPTIMIVIVVVEHGHAGLQQAAGAGQRGHARVEAGRRAPDGHDRVERRDVVVVDRVAADEDVLVVAAVEQVLVLAADDARRGQCRH